MSFNRSIAALTAALLLISGGCASYVNIPSETKDTAIHAVNTVPAPSIMAEAMSYAVKQHFVSPRHAFTLPYPASNETYARVWRRISDEAAPIFAIEAVESGLPLYQLVALRIRGNDAWATILMPPAIGDRRVLEVSLEGRWDGWHVRTAQRRYATSQDLELAARQVERITAAAMPPAEVNEGDVDASSDDPDAWDEPIETESPDDLPDSGRVRDDDARSQPLTPITPSRNQP